MWRIKRSSRLAAALLALLLFMLPPARAEEGGAAPDAHAQRRFVIELWQLVNAAREAAGVPPLTLDLALSAPNARCGMPFCGHARAGDRTPAAGWPRVLYCA